MGYKPPGIEFEEPYRPKGLVFVEPEEIVGRQPAFPEMRPEKEVPEIPGLPPIPKESPFQLLKEASRIERVRAEAEKIIRDKKNPDVERYKVVNSIAMSKLFKTDPATIYEDYDGYIDRLLELDSMEAPYGPLETLGRAFLESAKSKNATALKGLAFFLKTTVPPAEGEYINLMAPYVSPEELRTKKSEGMRKTASLLERAADYILRSQNPEVIENLRKINQYPLIPKVVGGKLDKETLRKNLIVWAAQVGDQLPLMLVTGAAEGVSKVASHFITSAIVAGSSVGGTPAAGAAITPAALAVGNVTEQAIKLLTAGTYMVALETGAFVDQAEALGLKPEAYENWAKYYGIAAGAVEYLQDLSRVKAFAPFADKITSAMQKNIVTRVLRQFGLTTIEGLEEVTQNALQNFFMGKAIDDMAKLDPGFKQRKPELFEGAMREFATAFGVSAIMRGTASVTNRILGTSAEEDYPPGFRVKKLADAVNKGDPLTVNELKRQIKEAFPEAPDAGIEAVVALMGEYARKQGVSLEDFIASSVAAVSPGWPSSPYSLFREELKANGASERELRNAMLEKYGTADGEREFQSVLAWIRSVSGSDEAVAKNNKTLISIDFTTDCVNRNNGRPCFYCYVELKRLYEDILRDRKVEAAAELARKEMGERPAENAEEWENELARRTERYVAEAKKYKWIPARVKKVVRETAWDPDALRAMPKTLIQYLNEKMAGLRVNSFSDFEERLIPYYKELFAISEEIGLKLKIITKDIKTAEWALKQSPNVTVQVSTDIEHDPGFAGELSRGGMHGAISNAPKIEQTVELKNKYPGRVKVRYVSINLDDLINAARDPNIDVITHYHGFNKKILEEIFLKKMPELVKMIGPEGAKRLAAEVEGYRVYAEDRPALIRKIARRLKNREEAYAIARKIDETACCQSGKCGTCTVCCGYKQGGAEGAAEVLYSLANGVPRASIEWVQDGRAIIRGFGNADLRDLVHETAHLFWKTMPEETKRLAEEYYGVENGEWTRDQVEDFANNFELYLSSGTAPNGFLRNVFRFFRQFLRKIYAGLRMALDPKLREVYDSMFLPEAKPLDEARKYTVDESRIYSRIKRRGQTGPGFQAEELSLLSVKSANTLRLLGEKLDRERGTVSEVETDDMDAILEKSKPPDGKPWWGVEHVSDAVRLNVAVNSFNQALEVVKEATGIAREVMAVDMTRLWVPDLSGRRVPVVMLIRLDTGQIAKVSVEWARIKGSKRAAPDEKDMAAYIRDAYENAVALDDAWNMTLQDMGLDPNAAHASAINFARSVMSITGRKFDNSSGATVARFQEPRERTIDIVGTATQTDPSESRATMESSNIISAPPDSLHWTGDETRPLYQSGRSRIYSHPAVVEEMKKLGTYEKSIENMKLLIEYFKARFGKDISIYLDRKSEKDKNYVVIGYTGIDSVVPHSPSGLLLYERLGDFGIPRSVVRDSFEFFRQAAEWVDPSYHEDQDPMQVRMEIDTSPYFIWTARLQNGDVAKAGRNVAIVQTDRLDGEPAPREAVSEAREALDAGHRAHPIAVEAKADGRYRVVDGQAVYDALVEMGIQKVAVQIVGSDKDVLHEQFASDELKKFSEFYWQFAHGRVVEYIEDEENRRLAALGKNYYREFKKMKLGEILGKRKKIGPSVKEGIDEGEKIGIAEERGKIEEKIRKRRLREYALKLAKAICMKPPDKMDFVQKDAIRVIQSYIDPVFRSQKTLDERAQTIRYLEENPDKIADMPKRVLNNIRKRSLNDITLEELEEIHDEVMRLWGQGMAKARMRERNKKREKERVVKTLVKTIVGGKEIVEEKWTGRKRMKMGFLKAAKRWVDAQTLEPQRLFDLLDGGQDFNGPNHSYFYDQVEELYDAVVTAYDARRKWLFKRLDEYGVKPRELAKKIRIEVDGKKIVYTVDEVMEIYAGLKNPLKAYAVTVDENLSWANAGRLVSMLEEKYKKAADAIIQEYDMNKERLREAHIRARNEDMGYEIYYTPIVRLNKEYTDYAAQLSDEIAERLHLRRAAMLHGFTEKRVQRKEDVILNPIRLGLVQNWVDIAQKQEYYIQYAELIDQMQAVVHDERFENAVKTVHGQSVLEAIRKRTNNITTQWLQGDYDAMARLSRTMRHHTGLARLAYNLVTVSKQLAALPRFLPEAGPHRLILSCLRFASNPVGMIRECEELSPQLKHATIERFQKELRQTSKSAYERIIKKVGSAGMEAIYLFDKIPRVIGFWAVYKKESRRVGEAAAIRKAQNAVNRTQSAAENKDLASIYASSEWLNWLTMFTSEANRVWNILYYDIPTWVRRGNEGKAFLAIVGFMMSNMMIFAITRRRLPEDWEDFYLSFKEGLFDAIPLIGTAMTNAMRGFDTGLDTTITYLGESLESITRDIEKMRVSDRTMRLILEASALVLGLPYNMAKRIWKTFEEWDWMELIGGPPREK